MAIEQQSGCGNALEQVPLRDLISQLRPFAKPNNRRGLIQIVSTLIAFAGTISLMFFALRTSYAITLALALPAGALLVRLFVLQHDCGHGSLLRSRFANDMVGRLLAFLAFTPYSYWRAAHALHHTTSGNLDKRGAGDIDTLTVAEYRALPPLAKFGYRVLRNPCFLLFVGSTLHFLIKQRLPWRQPGMNRRHLRSVHYTNLALVLCGLAIYSLGVLGDFVLVYIPIIWVASMLGFWLFYLQHHIADAYWAREAEWDYQLAALRGSTLIDLPPVLRWISADIGIHHIHHLLPRIPNYRLRQCLVALPELQHAPRISIKEAILSLNLGLWDEEKQRLVAFHELTPA